MDDKEKIEAIQEIIKKWLNPITIKDGRMLSITAMNQIRKILED